MNEYRDIAPPANPFRNDTRLRSDLRHFENILPRKESALSMYELYDGPSSCWSKGFNTLFEKFR